MTASNDEGRPRREDGPSSNHSNRVQGSARNAIADAPWHVVPRATSVRAGSGRDRVSLIYKCPCRLNHEVYVRELLSSTLRRKTPCGNGWVTLHLDTLAVAA